MDFECDGNDNSDGSFMNVRNEDLSVSDNAGAGTDDVETVGDLVLFAGNKGTYDEEDVFENEKEKDNKFENEKERLEKEKENKKDAKDAKDALNKAKLAWIKTMTTDHIVETDKGDDVGSIGGVDIKELTMALILVFCWENNISIPNAHRKRNLIGPLIISHIKSQKMKSVIATPAKIKIKAKSKPYVLKHDGTYYRIVNVITSSEGGKLFIQTKVALSRESLDIRNNDRLWEDMADIYKSDKDEISLLSDPDNNLSGFFYK